MGAPDRDLHAQLIYEALTYAGWMLCRFFNRKQGRGLATLHTAPEFPLGRHDEVLVQRTGMGGDLDPFARDGWSVLAKSFSTKQNKICFKTHLASRHDSEFDTVDHISWRTAQRVHHS